jgi:dTMP kinase
MTFIALEGGEGVGKSTQARLLITRLKLEHPEREFVLTREPGGTPFAEKIRALIVSEEGMSSSALTMFALFSAARADHVVQLIQPALKRGAVVISDRFIGSSFAYQRCALENPISSELFDAVRIELGLMPSLSIIFDMDPRDSQKRIQSRSGDKSKFDTESMLFHQKLRHGYAEFVKYCDARNAPTVMINADRSKEQVHEDLFQIVSGTLNKK